MGSVWRFRVLVGAVLASGALLTGCAQTPETDAPTARAVEAQPVKVIEHHIREDRWHRPIDVDEATYVRRAQKSERDREAQ